MNEKPEPSSPFPQAKIIAKTFGTDFSAEICRRKAIADIRELLVDHLKPHEYVDYVFHEKTAENDIVAIVAMLKETGYNVFTANTDPWCIHISLPENLLSEIK